MKVAGVPISGGILSRGARSAIRRGILHGEGQNAAVVVSTATARLAVRDRHRAASLGAAPSRERSDVSSDVGRAGRRRRRSHIASNLFYNDVLSWWIPGQSWPAKQPTHS